jgi:lysophospholipase L1-like esterase
MKAQLRQIMQDGQAKGKQIDVFAKIGDSITESMAFLNDYCCGWYDLGSHMELEEIIQYFATAHVDELQAQVNPYHTSFDRMSLAAQSGAHTAHVLEGGADSGLMQEISAIQPGLAIIMFGTNEDLAGEDVAAFKANLAQIVTVLKGEGVIPILSTIPDLVPPAEGSERVSAFNQAMKEVALEERVPLVDYWQALQPLPNKGLGEDGMHPSVYMEGDEYRSADLTTAHQMPVCSLLRSRRLNPLRPTCQQHRQPRLYRVFPLTQASLHSSSNPLIWSIWVHSGCRTDRRR